MSFATVQSKAQRVRPDAQFLMSLNRLHHSAVKAPLRITSNVLLAKARENRGLQFTTAGCSIRAPPGWMLLRRRGQNL